MQGGVILLDGGMGRELMRIGAPFRQPEWSALALMEAPETVEAVHQDFLQAGSKIVTTNSYALVPFHIGEQRFRDQAQTLANLSGRLARQAVERASHTARVAGSLPPLFGSYRPDLFNARTAQSILEPLIAGLSPWVDIWLGETLGSIAEAEAIKVGLDRADSEDQRPLWLSFTLEDIADDRLHPPRLRSGESIAASVAAAYAFGAHALLFNCSQPEVMLPAITLAATAIREQATLGQTALKLGVYANTFEDRSSAEGANETTSGLRRDLTPDSYLTFVRRWVEAGACIVGGCCGIGPEHIRKLHEEIPL